MPYSWNTNVISMEISMPSVIAFWYKKNISFFYTNLKLKIHSFLVIVFCTLTLSTNSFAFEVDEVDGWSGSLDTTISFGASYRTQDPDNSLYSAASGARAGLGSSGFGSTNTDSGNVNYSKGDAFANLLKATIDYSLQKEDMGLFTRMRAWTDFALEGNSVNQGNSGSNYAQGEPLSDDGFAHLGKFSGVTVLDAYVYNTFDIKGYPMQLRLGNQVINWGESLFVQGINQINPIDLNALRKPGVEVRDASSKSLVNEFRTW